MHGAALQFVRKISGFRKPSRANQMAFEQAVMEIAESGRRMLDVVQRPPLKSTPAQQEKSS